MQRIWLTVPHPGLICKVFGETSGGEMKTVFMHIPKTGGTSLHHMLLKHFDREQVCPERFNHLTKLKLEEFERYLFFSGHYDRHNVSLVPEPKRVVTILREPESRIISLYKFWRAHNWETINKENLGGPRIAKSLNFRDFLRKDGYGIPGNIDNIQVRTFLGELKVTGSFPQRTFICPEDEVVDIAKEYLDSLDAYAIMEVYEESVSWIFRTLELPTPQQIARLNTLNNHYQSARTDEIVEIELDDEIKEILDILTWADKQLYKYALKKFKTNSLRTRY